MSSSTKQMRKTFTRSGELLSAAMPIPGASLTRSKAPGKMFAVGSGPLYAGTARGATIVDVDGNAFIDMVCALGAISLGYGDRDVADAARVEIYNGWISSLPHAFEIESARTFLGSVAPWASRVRFVKTGSEATHAAYRVAKVATGRPFVLTGDWAYHGWHEWCWFDEPSRISASKTALRYSHGDDLDKVLRDTFGVAASDVAAVFVEPHRWEAVDRAWLTRVREWCDRTGALLVFDEMIYGGRWAIGGASQYFGVQPDLACYGKAFGNGAPIACVVGNEALAKHGEIVSGTYSGDVASLSALVATVRTYERSPVVETLWERGRQLARGLDAVAKASPVACRREGEPVHQRLRFDDPANGKLFAAAMAARGVLWHPDVVNVCFAHTAGQIEHVVASAIAAVLDEETWIS